MGGPVVIGTAVLIFCIPLAFAAGLFAGWIGTWIRFQRIEARLRALGVAAYECSMFEGEVPAQWVSDQIDWVLEEEFR